MTSFYLLNKSFAIVVFQQVCHSLGSCIACKSWLWETFNKCWNFTLNLLILSGGVSRFVPYLISWIVTLWLKKKKQLMWFKPRQLILLVFQYDPRFGDAFWNSTKHSMMTYLFNMLTSWAIVCNVWYLPSMVKEVLMRLNVLKVLVKCLEGCLCYCTRCLWIFVDNFMDKEQEGTL